MSGNFSHESSSNELNPKHFSYFSQQDVDGDGTSDVVHATGLDGVKSNFYLDESGEVILTEKDVDRNGTFESTFREVSGTDIELKLDKDEDGAVDQVRFYDKSSGQTFQQNEVVAGKVTHIYVDSDKDGVTDFELEDTDDDGQFDTVKIDSDHDGHVNARYVDTDSDGNFDEGLVDVDNSDGILETRVFADEFGVGSLGNVDLFTDALAYPVTDQLGKHSEFDFDETSGSDQW